MAEGKVIGVVLARFDETLRYLLSRERVGEKSPHPEPLMRAGLYTAAAVLVLAAEVKRAVADLTDDSGRIRVFIDKGNNDD